MEDVTLGALDWFVRAGAGGGLLGLLWLVIKFYGSSQKDATDAALSLYKLVKSERDEFAVELSKLRVEIAALRIDLEEERKARVGLERQLAAQSNAAAYLLNRPPVDKS